MTEQTTDAQETPKHERPLPGAKASKGKKLQCRRHGVHNNYATFYTRKGKDEIETTFCIPCLVDFLKQYVEIMEPPKDG